MALDDQRTHMTHLKDWARSIIGAQNSADARTNTKSEIAFKVIETLISSMELRPGAYYSVDQFCDILGMGRSPVRDALKQLETEGLVDLRRRVGVRIQEPLLEKMGQLLVVRTALELVATREAILNGTDSQKDIIGYLAVQILESATKQDTSSFMHIGVIMYQQMLQATKNEYLEKYLIPIYSMSRRIYFYNMKQSGEFFNIGRLHSERLRCIAKSDIQGGVKATEAMMDFIGKAVAQRIKVVSS
ncbi:GntR family transcriptional regulator [Aminobacter sp. Piv2-1]|uniref:GntR family transcriptional regulator n=1 Tax=Aminobacter sp. Piv2-1 TaxID=3031122 RepID=UPI003099FEFB